MFPWEAYPFRIARVIKLFAAEKKIFWIFRVESDDFEMSRRTALDSPGNVGKGEIEVNYLFGVPKLGAT